jgi:PAS domain S-box-containing protein
MHARGTAEIALRESEERYRAVVAALEEGIVLHEADGSVTSCNASACRILGVTEEQLLGRTSRNPPWRAIREDGSPFEPESHPATITLLTGQPCSGVVMGIERADDSRAWVSINSRPLRRDGQADPYAVAVSFTDITHLKVSERELRRQAEQQAAIADLARHALEGTGTASLLEEAVRRVAAVLEVEICKVAERVPGSARLRLRAGLGWVAGPGGRPQLDPAPAPGERLAGAIVPIPGRSRPWGVLSAHTRMARDIGVQEVQFLRSVANVLAVALERRQDQEALRASEARHRALVEALPDLIYRIGRDGTYLDVPFGRPGDGAASVRPARRAPQGSRVQGRQVADLLPAAVAEEAMELIGRALDTGEIQVHEYDAPRDGEIRSFEARLLRSGAEEVLAVVRDITARKRIEESQERLQLALRTSAQEWRLTFDALPHPLLLVDISDRGGKVVRMNLAARDLSGVEFEEAIQQPLAVLGRVGPWVAVHSLLDEVDRTGAGASGQTRDDQGRSWDITLSPVTSPEAQRGAVVVARDITDLVRLQESLRRSETMSAMGALIAGVAHEVRNPLFGISATLDAFEARFRKRKDLQRYFEVLQAEVRRLSELMQQLLDYGKPHRLEPARVDPAELMRRAATACEPLAGRARIAVTLEPDGGLPAIEVDPARAVQVFQNLIENAIQHSPPGAEVRFRAARAPSPDTAGGEAAETVRFLVEDAGPGFRPDDLSRIFEPFFTRRRGGTGLGLSIVQRIVEQHGGEVEAENRPGGGAAMAVVLPVRRAGSGAPPKPFPVTSV